MATNHADHATDLADIQALDSAYVMHTFARRPVAFTHGHGAVLTASDGATYTDFLAGIATVSLGYDDPAVTAAIVEQAGKLVHVSNLYHVEHRGELAQALVELFDGEDYIGDAHPPSESAPARVFFSNSGAEANEAAIKLARRWAKEHKPAADTILTLLGSFHGRTLATVAATGQPDRALPFAPVMPGFAHVPLNDVAALEAAIGSGQQTIAVMVEIIQGESGVWPASAEYLGRLSELCAETNTLLIVDEIQTGMYRTGAPFAYRHFGLSPDIVTSAKALANGMPIGACIAATHVADALKVGEHGSTFAGGPLVAAAALATLRRYREMDAIEHVSALGAYLRDSLAGVSGIGQVRGAGLMVGFSLTDETLATTDASSLATALFEAGYLVNAIGERSIRLVPPFVIEKSHIDGLVAALNAIINGNA